MINNVVLMGRLVKDVEIKSTQSGVEVTSFTLAVERSFQKKGEEKQTDFIDCVAWRQTAAFIAKYFKKGSMIAVTGEIQVRPYEDKNGNKRKAVEVVVSNVSFCGGKGNSNSLDVSTVPSSAPSDFEEIGNDEDLPF